MDRHDRVALDAGRGDDAVTQKRYQSALEELKTLADSLANTRMMALAKIQALIVLNVRYERIMTDRALDTDPRITAEGFVRASRDWLAAWAETQFIEDPGAKVLTASTHDLEDGHRDLFQELWTQFSVEEYEGRIARYQFRLHLNQLDGEALSGRSGIDFGCGHGNFAHALLREGASYVYGVDFGENSIAYATAARDRLGVGPERLEFAVSSVYNVPREDASFDFAIQNGVFHHLEDEDAAIREVHRVLKPGAWLWYYTDGAGGIARDLWDASVHILRDVPRDLTISYLAYLGIETGKRYHLGDGLNATYRHTTWDEITGRLRSHGFDEFRRLAGGFPTDCDHDVIAADRWGLEKFGDGDLRLLCRKR